MSAAVPEAGSITMYTTTWCGYCRNLKKQLASTDIQINEINIEEHPDAASFVESVNNGDQVVPTVVFPDGSSATNPTAREVKERVQG